MLGFCWELDWLSIAEMTKLKFGFATFNQKLLQQLNDNQNSSNRVIDDKERQKRCHAWKFIFYLSTASKHQQNMHSCDEFQLKLVVRLHSKQLTKLNLSLLQWVTREIKSCCLRQRWIQLLFLWQRILVKKVLGMTFGWCKSWEDLQSEWKFVNLQMSLLECAMTFARCSAICHELFRG